MSTKEGKKTSNKLYNWWKKVKKLKIQEKVNR